MSSTTRHKNSKAAGRAERGTAMIIAIMIMGLLALFVAATLSRVTSEALVMSNDHANTAAFYAAQASLELMSRNFDRIFDTHITPTEDDIAGVAEQAPALAGYSFNQQIVQTNAGQPPVQGTIATGPFAGLYSLRDPWRMQTTATGPTGAQVQLTRTFYNHLVPIFQFGVFNDRDMEFAPGPVFNFGGRVHTNGHLFLSGNAGLYFRSRVSASGHIVHDVQRNGQAPSSPYNVSIWDGAGSYIPFTEGSVDGGPDVNGSDPDLPDGTINTGWETFSQQFNGNLVAGVPRLRLPLQVGENADPIEIIKRGREDDSPVMAASRFYNKECIRVSLDDSQGRLPGGAGGVRLDGDANGTGGQTTADRGYRPTPMADGYAATRFNGNRLYTGPSYDGNPRETWIKVEIVKPDPDDPANPVTQDITEDFLSLGLTARAPQLDQGGFTFGDDRAILEMQRFVIPGPPLKVANVNAPGNTPVFTTLGMTGRVDPRDGLGTRTFYNYVASGGGYSCVTRQNGYLAGEQTGAHEYPSGGTITISVAGTPTATKVVPFPIEMYDIREGLSNDSMTTADWGANFTANASNANVPAIGVMSLIDVNVANLRTFLDGGFDGAFPNGLSSADIPQNGGRGVILYISDRRGDADNDGVHDMENVYIGTYTDDSLQPGEDIAGDNAPGEVDLAPDGSLQADYIWESARYNASLPADFAAVVDHRYFRRAVRLVRGQVLPGDATRGFTLASENGVYIHGNYNASGIAATPSGTTPTSSDDYNGPSVPASVVGDAVTILSNAWNDGKSFRRCFTFWASGEASTGPTTRGVPFAGETTVRTAILCGSTKSSIFGTPNQGGTQQRLDGGVHNFPRFLEHWTVVSPGTRLNYCGSMINLFPSRGNNGAYKFGSNHVYSAPYRNWTFDDNFLVAEQLPPGTPFFQYVQMTGFRQTLRQVD